MRRRFTSVLAAATITLALFAGMRGLIAASEMILDDYVGDRLVEFVRIQRPSEAQTKDRRLPDRQTPKPPPPTPEVQADDLDSQPGATTVAAPSLDLSGAAEIGTYDLNAAPSDNDPVPVVRVEPIYPPRAEENLLEGWVELEFDISQTGATTNVRVLKAKPPGIFDRAAVKAVSKWKYRPQVVDGKARLSRGQRVTLAFELK